MNAHVAVQLAVLVADVLSRYGQNAACTTELAAADSSTVQRTRALRVRYAHGTLCEKVLVRCAAYVGSHCSCASTLNGKAKAMHPWSADSTACA
jgi:hypothetical protein